MISRFFHRKTDWRKDSPNRNNNAGLTILELLTVVGILAILAAIGIPSFLGVKDKATIGATEGNLAIIKKSLNTYMADNPSNRYPIGSLDYTALRDQIPFANLPISEDRAKILTGSMAYSSDGTTFTISANSTARGNQQFTVTPSGITRN